MVVVVVGYYQNILYVVLGKERREKEVKLSLKQKKNFNSACYKNETET